VGERLALAARAIAYDEDLVYSGPMYRSMKVKGDKAILTFDHTGESISSRPLPNAKDTEATLTFDASKGTLSAPLTGFAIAGEDRKFVWADAKIVDEQVVVSSPYVPKPVAVRYGWADYPVVNLWCVGGLGTYALPASPFRTDDWPMITTPKQEVKK
jgi:sialate O-acetylesterase